MPAPLSTLPAPTRRRIQIRAWILVGALLLLMGAIWQATVYSIRHNQRDMLVDSSHQVASRLENYLRNRLMTLRTIAHFFSTAEAVQERNFQAFCSAMLYDNPGILVIILTDSDGQPVWIAPSQALSLNEAYPLMADPRLKRAIERTSNTMEPSLTETIAIPSYGEGCIAVTPVIRGQRHEGFVAGVFYYQSLFSLPPELVTNWRLTVFQGGRSIFPSSGGDLDESAKLSAAAEGIEHKIFVGHQAWSVFVSPMKSDTWPLSLVSIIILFLGIGVVALAGWMVYRRMIDAATRVRQAEQERRVRREDQHSGLGDIKSQLELIMNGVDEGIVLYNDRLEPIQTNAAFLASFCWTPGDLGMQSGDMHHDHMIQWIGSETNYWSLFNALRTRPEQTYIDELEIAPQPGTRGQRKVYLRWATAILNPEGERRGIIVIYKDVTNTKAIDMVKEEFLSNVSHELRSPLSSIKGFAEMLRRDPNLQLETRQEFISIICEESERLGELIEEMLEMRKMDAGAGRWRVVPFDMRSLVEEVVRSTRSMVVSKNINLQVQWSGLFGTRIEGDVAQLNRAIRNLLVNAIKYSPEGGEVMIRGKGNQHQIWLEVSDRGPGIHEQDLPHIFDKFYRGSYQEKQKGTGLGLAIVKQIVERHGGHIGVHSEVGSGTTFRVELPRTYKAPVVPEGAMSAVTTGPAAPRIREMPIASGKE